MSYGYSQVNTNGYMQIDDTLQNIRLVASGTGTTDTLIHVSTAFSTKPIIAVGPPAQNSYMSISQAYLDSGDNTLYFKITSDAYPSTLNFNYPYRVYAKIESTSGSTNYGMQVFDSSGNCTFDSNYDFQGIRYISDISSLLPSMGATDPGTGVVSLTHNVGGTPYVWANQFVMPSGLGFTGYSGSNKNYCIERVSWNNFNANTIYFKRIPFTPTVTSSPYVAGPYNWNPPYKLFLGR